MCGKELSNGDLVVVLPQYKLSKIELLAIYPVTHRGALKVKLFVDFIARRYSGDLPWDAAVRTQKTLAAESKLGSRSLRSAKKTTASRRSTQR